MPVGIATRLAAAEQPAWWGTNQGTFTALATTNVIKSNSSAKNGEEFYADLITALGAADPKYSNGTPVWVCNHKTHVALQCKALAFDGAAALTAGVTSEMPIIGGKIVELDFVPDNEIIEIRGLKIDKTARRVWVNGEEKNFTTKEFDLLTFLAQNPNHVYTKEELFNKIWDMESIGDIATVTVHIKKIREKIEFNTAKPQYIETIWGVGYRFKV